MFVHQESQPIPSRSHLTLLPRLYKGKSTVADGRNRWTDGLRARLPYSIAYSEYKPRREGGFRFSSNKDDTAMVLLLNTRRSSYPQVTELFGELHGRPKRRSCIAAVITRGSFCLDYGVVSATHQQWSADIFCLYSSSP